MTVELNLIVNDSPIRTDYFVEAFIDHTVSGMMEALEGTGEIGELDLSIEGETVSIVLNGDKIPTNAFVNKIMKATIEGMVSTLKGVKEIKKLSITIRK